ncbi:MAG: Fe(2+)-trafficking protein [Acidobacteria bacterium]|nr:Fe(2+)-trafficking protein [Acidobacteriota bacterium]
MSVPPEPAGPAGPPGPSAPPPAAAADFHCVRCGRAGAPRLRRPPLPGASGREVQAQVCADCWAEWGRAEVMVINELRLNFMDPAAQEVLDRHMREFLHLPPGGAAATAAGGGGGTGGGGDPR